MPDCTAGGKLKGCSVTDWNTADGQQIGVFLL
jgi:hypothetical protein